MTGKQSESYVLVQNQVLVAAGARFKVIDRLGSGGNSSVYMVQCVTGPHRGLLFAAKLFTRADKDDRLERFRVELDFLKNPQHPAVMRVHYDGTHPFVEEGGEVRQLPFYIAEYLPKTLRDGMRSGLLMVDKVTIAMQLLSALAYLSDNDPVIVHRDIKPENIFVKGRSAVLGDFGLLKAVGVGEGGEFSIGSLSNGIRHPRLYPSPELIEYSKGRVADISAKSDVFQLGLVFAEMFCGVSPLVDRKVFDQIELAELDGVPGSQGELIRTNIRRMLTIDVGARPSASDLFDPWDGVFMSVLDDARKLEGRAFW